ncbi:MAG: EI24 domain-containing protein [Burkholderiales bacterium]
MPQIFDAFWRAALYCLHPRVILLSLLALVLAGGLAMGLAYFYWDGAVAAVRDGLEQWALLGPVTAWLDGFSGGMFRTVIGPLVVVALAVPVLLIVSLLLVSVFMSEAVVQLVARRRFAGLEKCHGGGWWGSLAGSLGATLVALLVLLVTVPLWLIPPMALLLPPLIWGWLSYRVMSYDALADHASTEERRTLMREHRGPLLAIGVVTGYFGMAPSLIWATVSAMTLPFMPLLLPVFVWLYTLVFAFAALWFTHYALAALNRLRRDRLANLAPLDPVMPVGAMPPTAEPPALGASDLHPLPFPPA